MDAIETARTEIAAAWERCRDSEHYGMEFGKVCYEWREKFTAQGKKGKGLRAILHQVNIPVRTAYWWIDRYEVAAGLKPPRAKTPDFRYATSPNGHTTWELKSWLQKSIRRGLEEDALYAAVELDLTGFPGAVWETLHHSASEDIGLADPNVCVVVGTLHGLWKHAHGVIETASEDGAAERLYLVHAVLACVHAKKSRLVDNALTVAYGDHSKREVPSWAHDKHTDQGKKLGHGFAHFFDEAALLADKDGSLHKPNDAYAEKARAICIAKEGQTR